MHLFNGHCFSDPQLFLPLSPKLTFSIIFQKPPMFSILSSNDEPKPIYSSFNLYHLFQKFPDLSTFGTFLMNFSVQTYKDGYLLYPALKGGGSAPSKTLKASKSKVQNYDFETFEIFTVEYQHLHYFFSFSNNHNIRNSFF